MNIYRHHRRLAISCFLLLLGCSERQEPASQPRPVRVTSIHFQQVSDVAHYSGEIRPRHEAPLAFQVGGRLVRRLVDVGAAVKSGQLLATLDPADYRLGEAGAAAQLAAAEAELAQARKDLRHLGNLKDQALASPAAVERREDQLRAAEARVASAQANLGSQARQSGYTELRADRDGVITMADAEPGQVLAAGQAAFRLAQPGEKEVVISVPENHLEGVRSTSSIRVNLWANPERFYGGKVREISPAADAVLRTFTIKVAVLDADDALRMGMTATAHVQQSEPQPVARVPLSAVTRQGERPAVWVFDIGTHTVQPRTVTISAYDENSAKLVEGVQEGEQVVTAGVHKLVPGQPARILGAELP
jgi:multidrug efflux system membrane fusion protein